MRLHSKGFITILVLIFPITCVTSAAWAQLYTGTITGIITDPSGAVVRGAGITITDVGKQVPYSTVSDSAGRYLLRSMPPSTYTMKVEMDGFATYIQDNVIVLVNQNLSIDVSLKLGTEAQSVEVMASTVSLSTQDAVTGQEVDRTLINDLPLLGRGVFDLVNLSPGIYPRMGPYVAAGGVPNNFVSNGSRNATADVLLDGVSATSPEQNTGIQTPLYTPSVDSVQEFKVQQSNFSAEIGFTGATVMNVVTRSGTNTLHGTVYDFLRNSVLTANNWFSNAWGGKLPARRYNDFGATAGGKIIKDKLFFFGSYEGVRDIPAAYYSAGVPSPAEKRGDFGELCGAGFDSAGQCTDPAGQLWDPYSGVYDPSQRGPVRSRFIPFNNLATYVSPGNPKLIGTPGELPIQRGNLIDPVASKMIQYFPDPNLGVGTPSYNRYNNWQGGGSNRNYNDQYDIKIDYNISDKDRLSGKFSQGYNRAVGANAFGNVLDPTNNNGGSVAHTNLFALNYTHTFNPTTLLTASFGFSRNYYNSQDIMAANNQTATGLLGMPSYIESSGFQSSPAVFVGDYSSIGSAPWAIIREAPQTWHLTGSVSKIMGRHDLKFGGEFRVHQNNFLQACCGAGNFGFGFGGTSQTPQWGDGGDGMASFLTGTGIGGGGSYEIPARVSSTSFRIAGYVQDNWRVNDKLTLNLGLRYDLDTPRTERYNRMSYLDPVVKSPLHVPEFPNLKGGVGFVDSSNRHNYGWAKHDFGPRFGLAYKLKEMTVMRGGYGLFYSVPLSTVAGTGGGGVDGFDVWTPWMTSYQNDGATPWGRLSNPFPGGVDLPTGSSLGAMTSVGNTLWDPNRYLTSMPYEQTWNFGFQQELPGQILVDANYVGKKGTHLYFGGAGEYNHLGPEVESYSLDQITALNEMVPNPFYGQIPADTALGGPEVPAYQLQLPYPQFTGFGVIAFPVANSIYHAFQLQVEKRMSHGLQLLANYTFSKSIDDASTTHFGVTWLGGGIGLQDPNKYYLERSLSDFDIPQVLNIGYVYQLPFGRGKAVGSNWNGVTNSILGGWQTNGIWRFSRGTPIGLWLAGSISLPTYGGQRPNLTGALLRNEGDNFRDQYFANPEVVVTPEPYTVGTAPRVVSSVRNPGIKNANLSMFKNFPLGVVREGMALQFRAEFFNAFNTPFFCGPGTGLNNWDFGQVQSTCGPAREVQLALKFVF